MIYLASPYSHPDAKVREARFVAANRAAYRLMQRGEVVFSPISHSHSIEVESGVIGDHEFWARQDDAFQAQCRKVAVLIIDGWQESRGVQREIQLAKENGMSVEFLGPEWAEPIVKGKTAYELAAELTKGDRNKDYGSAFENHEGIALIWNGILRRKLKADICPREVMLCMIGTKLNREAYSHKQDNLTDTIGYAKLIDEDERFNA